MNKEYFAGRLCLVAHKFQRNDGQGRVNYEVVWAALEAGYHVTLVAVECAQDLIDHPNLRAVLIRVQSLPTELLRNLIFANRSAAYLRRHRSQFDLVQVNGFVTWEAGDVVAAHFVHSSWQKSPFYPFKRIRPYDLYQRLYTLLNSRWEKSAFRRARRVIAVSPSVREDLLEIGVPLDRIVVIPNGVDLAQFTPGRPNRASLRLPAEGVIALFVGDIRTPRKNLETVLKAMGNLPRLTLAVAGASQGSPYPAQATEMGIGDRVLFLGKVGNIDELMRSVDFFVFPSRYEAHPLVLLEAMASGLPSVVPDRFGAPELVGDSGLNMGDPNDAERLRTLLHQLLEDVEGRKRMGAAARQRVLRMSWSTMAGRYLDVYRELMPGPPAPVAENR